MSFAQQIVMEKEAVTDCRKTLQKWERTLGQTGNSPSHPPRLASAPLLQRNRPSARQVLNPEPRPGGSDRHRLVLEAEAEAEQAPPARGCRDGAFPAPWRPGVASARCLRAVRGVLERASMSRGR